MRELNAKSQSNRHLLTPADGSHKSGTPYHSNPNPHAHRTYLCKIYSQENHESNYVSPKGHRFMYGEKWKLEKVSFNIANFKLVLRILLSNQKIISGRYYQKYTIMWF